uniref:Ig-like domain-containing protein n=1 Tax=Meleagris gallopavo TaxID=9103 RepID=A0A803Y5T3_MELGA
GGWTGGSLDSPLLLTALLQPVHQPSIPANLGETVKITCSGSNSIYGYSLYQQKSPGSALVTVIYENTKRPSNIPSRFSGSYSGSTLTITGVQAEDEAVYYCASWDSSTSAGSDRARYEMRYSLELKMDVFCLFLSGSHSAVPLRPSPHCPGLYMAGQKSHPQH